MLTTGNIIVLFTSVFLVGLIAGFLMVMITQYKKIYIKKIHSLPPSKLEYVPKTDAQNYIEKPQILPGDAEERNDFNKDAKNI